MAKLTILCFYICICPVYPDMYVSFYAIKIIQNKKKEQKQKQQQQNPKICYYYLLNHCNLWPVYVLDMPTRCQWSDLICAWRQNLLFMVQCEYGPFGQVVSIKIGMLYPMHSREWCRSGSLRARSEQLLPLATQGNMSEIFATRSRSLGPV